MSYSYHGGVVETEDIKTMTSNIESVNNEVNDEFDYKYKHQFFDILDTSWTSPARDMARAKLEGIFHDYFGRRYDELNDYVLFNKYMTEGWNNSEELNTRIGNMQYDSSKSPDVCYAEPRE